MKFKYNKQKPVIFNQSLDKTTIVPWSNMIPMLALPNKDFKATIINAPWGRWKHLEKMEK